MHAGFRSHGTAILVALAAGLLFGKIRHWTQSLYWLFGVPFALAGIQPCPVLVPDFNTESGSDQILVAAAGFARWMLGGAFATLIIQWAGGPRGRPDEEKALPEDQ